MDISATPLPTIEPPISSTHTTTLPPTPSLSSIGDSIWYDDNGDGLRDTDEEGIPGVVLNLVDQKGAIQTRVTDLTGNYTFENLYQSVYTLILNEQTLPLGLLQTAYPPNMVSENGELRFMVELEPGEQVTNYDFGYQRFGCIGDRVWIDANANGLQETGERGVTNALLSLVDSNDEVVATTTTGANGIYNFCNLVEGTYTVIVNRTSIPGDASQTYELDGTLNNKTTIILEGGQNLLEVDFGYQNPIDLELTKTASPQYVLIGESVTFEIAVVNRGINVATGISVLESMPSNLVFNSHRTLAGTYDKTSHLWTIGNLDPGQRVTLEIDVSMDGPGPYTNEAQVFTVQQSDNDSIPGNGDLSEDDHDQATVSQKPTLLGDTVWLDENANGIQDPNERGLPEIDVNLYDFQGNVVDTDVTDEDGIYELAILGPGLFSVGVMPPDEYAITLNDVGDNDELDSDIAPLTFQTDNIIFESNVVDNSIDIGLVRALVNLRLHTADNDVLAQPNELIAYTLTYANVGELAAENVVIQAIVPEHTLFVAAESDSRWICDQLKPINGQSVCTITLGTVNSIGKDELSFVVRVDQNLPRQGDIISVVTIWSDTIAPGGASGSITMTPIWGGTLTFPLQGIFLPWFGTQ